MASKKRTRKKRIPIPIEALIGILLLIIIAGITAVTWKAATTPLPAEEICDAVDNDLDGLVDEGFPVTCNDHVDCGPTEDYGEKYCKNGDVYVGHYESTCVSLGTCMSECTSRQTERLVKDCADGCLKGRCVGN